MRPVRGLAEIHGFLNAISGSFLVDVDLHDDALTETTPQRFCMAVQFLRLPACDPVQAIVVRGAHARATLRAGCVADREPPDRLHPPRPHT
jgi:hypothetical protein